MLSEGVLGFLGFTGLAESGVCFSEASTMVGLVLTGAGVVKELPRPRRMVKEGRDWLIGAESLIPAETDSPSAVVGRFFCPLL